MRKIRSRLGIYAIAAVALLLVLVLGIQTLKMKQMEKSYQDQQARLEREIAQEEAKKLTLEDQRIYTQTKQYIEEQARLKFGLVMPDEILLKGTE